VRRVVVLVKQRRTTTANGPWDRRCVANRRIRMLIRMLIRILIQIHIHIHRPYSNAEAARTIGPGCRTKRLRPHPRIRGRVRVDTATTPRRRVLALEQLLVDCQSLWRPMRMLELLPPSSRQKVSRNSHSHSPRKRISSSRHI
jgi:hypothetical protein